MILLAKIARRVLGDAIAPSIRIYTESLYHTNMSWSRFFFFVRSPASIQAEPLSFVTSGDESDRIPGCWKKWTVTDKTYGEIRASYIYRPADPSFLPCSCVRSIPLGFLSFINMMRQRCARCVILQEIRFFRVK